MTEITRRLLVAGYILTESDISRRKVITDWSNNTDDCEFKQTEWLNDPAWIGRYCPYCGIMHKRYEYELITMKDIHSYRIDENNNYAIGKFIDITSTRNYHEINSESMQSVQHEINTKLTEMGLSVPSQNISIIFVPLGEDGEPLITYYE